MDNYVKAVMGILYILSDMVAKEKIEKIFGSNFTLFSASTDMS